MRFGIRIGYVWCSLQHFLYILSNSPWVTTQLGNTERQKIAHNIQRKTRMNSQSTSQSQTCRNVRRLSVYISVTNLSPRTSSQSTSQSQTCRNVRPLSVHISVANLSPRTSSLSTTITNFHLIKKPVVQHTKLTNSNTCHWTWLHVNSSSSASHLIWKLN